MKKTCLKFLSAILLIFITILCLKKRIEFTVGHVENLGENSIIVPNPIWNEVKEFANSHHVNVDFAKNLTFGRSFELKNSEIFEQNDNSYDILIFGDSSASWGLSKTILNQLTSYKIGVFAYESAQPNARYWREIANPIAEKYLKPNGFVIHMFAPNWIEDAAPEQEQGMDQLNFFAKLSRIELDQFVEKKKNDRFKWLEIFSSEYLTKYNEFFHNQPFFAQNFLPKVDFYLKWVEKFTAPRLHLKKISNLESNDQSFFMLEPAQVLLLKEHPIFVSKMPDSQISSSDHGNAKVNATEFCKLNSKKIFIIPFSEPNSYHRLESLYDSIYKNCSSLINLHNMIPDGQSYPLQNSTHPVNVSIFAQSLLLGRYLQSMELSSKSP